MGGHIRTAGEDATQAMRRAGPSHDTRSGTSTFHPGRPPIHALTGLRFFAALLVLFSHLPELIPIGDLHVGLERQGAAGVTIFFVLSGFVLTYNYGDEFRSSTRGALTFMRARVARIAPMNAVALILATPAVLLFSTSTPTVTSWIISLFMLQSLAPAQALHLWNIPAWSISAEMFFYVAFPFFIWLVLGRIRRPRRMLALGGALFALEVLLFCALAVLVQRVMLDGGKDPADVTTMLERVKFFPGLRIGEFFLGCILGQAIVFARREHRRGWWTPLDRRRIRNGLLVVAVGGLLAVLVLPNLVDTPTQGLVAHLMGPGLYLTYTPLAVLLIAAIAWGPSAASPLLEHRAARAMGEASLSFYLLQWPMVLVVTGASWAPDPRTWWFSALAVAVLTGVSLLTARWIEVPTRAWLRGRPPAAPDTA